MTPIEKLDAVLIEISKHSNGIIFQDLYGHLTHSFHIKKEQGEIYATISNDQLSRIILKLQDDKYISYVSKPILNNIQIPVDYNFYFTTFDGNLFIQNNGYKQQKEDEKLKRWLKYIKGGALILFGLSTALWAAVQIWDRFSSCCGCHH